MSERWDVAVVGAGPAGAAAARVAAAGGARVLLVDAARFPRYKTCGGGLVGASLAELPESALDVVERRIDTVSMTSRRGRTHRIRAASPFLAMTTRERLDAALVDAAIAAGATFRDGVRVRGLEPMPEGVRLRTDGEPIEAAAVVGADGSAGIVGRHVGVRIARHDLGLELELEGVGGDWASRVHLGWGRDPGSYGWVFPKADRLTVGVIQARGNGAATRAYLRAFVAESGLADRPVLRSSGHQTRWRTAGSPLRRGRVLVAGDAAGLLEPWSREGISFALRSGRVAGAAALDRAGMLHYDAVLERELVPEQRAGAALLRVFERHPDLVDAGLRTRRGAAAFVRFSRGSLPLDAAAARREVRLALALLGR